MIHTDIALVTRVQMQNPYGLVVKELEDGGAVRVDGLRGQMRLFSLLRTQERGTGAPIVWFDSL